MDLEAILRRLISTGQITEEDAAQIWDYINSFTSEGDLAQRMNWLTQKGIITREEAPNVFQDLWWNTPSAEVELRKAAVAQREGETKHAEALTGSLNTVFNNPLITKSDLAGARGNIERNPNDIGLILSNLSNRVYNRGRGEEQAGRALVGGFGLPYKGEKPKTERAVDYSGMPSASDILNKYVEGTGLAPGSKLRSFLEGQLYDTASNIQASRKEWWEKVNAPEDLPESYPEAVNRLTQAAEKWDRIAAGAPSSTYTSDTYWGVGGLAKMATDAAARHRQQASSIKPEDYWQGNIPERNVGEDPLLKALRGKTKKKLEADFFRLSPSARGYSSRRFAPSVRF